MPNLSLALQGGGSHGAFTWGALDRLLDAVADGRFEITAISGTSAGAINAVVAACGLAEGGPALAKTRLAEAWRLISDRGAMSGNALFFGAPGPLGFNIDWNPGAIALEALGLVVSPYTNPFYRDALGPLLAELLPPERLRRLDQETSPRIFITAIDVARTERTSFTQPEISIDTIRASACLPTEFRAVQLGSAFYWDGGYLGNPALAPLLDFAEDLLLIMVNPLIRPDPPPTGPRAILDRLNEITFNASVVLEMNAITAVNNLLADLAARGIAYDGPYRPINLHLVQDDAFLASLGTVSKSSTSWPLLQRLHAAGYRAADRYLLDNGRTIGSSPTDDVRRGLVRPMLKG